MFNRPSVWVVGLLFLLSAFFAHTSPSTAEQNYRTAEIAQFELESFYRINNQLGFATLSRYEDQRLRALFNRALSAYFKVFEFKDPVWSTRTAYRITEMVDHFFQKQVFDYNPPYRQLELPSPFLASSSEQNPSKILQKLNVVKGELALLYETLERSARKLNKDKELLKDLQEKLQEKKKIWKVEEKIKSPFSSNSVVGILRDFNGKVYRFQKNNKWKPVAQFQPQLLQNALQNPQPTIRLSGLILAEKRPDSHLLPALLMLWKRQDTTAPLFQNLQNTLYGERERILLALKAIIQKEPISMETIMASLELPSAEKAWLLSFSKHHDFLIHSAKQLLEEKDPLAVSRALWVFYQANPKAALPIIKKYKTDKRQLVHVTCTRILEISSSYRP